MAFLLLFQEPIIRFSATSPLLKSIHPIFVKWRLNNSNNLIISRNKLHNLFCPFRFFRSSESVFLLWLLCYNEGLVGGSLCLWDHVYRIQRISSRYYEFRHIYDLDVYDQTHPNYVRILNFGDKKTGWLTHNPFKISISLLGKITPIFNPLKVPEMQ